MAERQEKQKLTLPRTDYTIGIVQAQFNDAVTNKQRDAAVECLEEYGISYEEVLVPGAYEIPYALEQMTRSGKFDGLIALGCLIKGGTIHFEVISYSVADAIQRVSVDGGLPVGFGIITANTQEQAEERTVIGYDAAHATLQSLASTEKYRS